MTDTDILQYLKAAANIATIIGVVFAMVTLAVALRTYRKQREKERLEREYTTFNDLDDKYVEFMYACTQHPNLDVFSDAADSNRHLTQEDLNTERALYSVLISIFERAFVMFKGQTDKKGGGRQYQGWIECMRTYCKRKPFIDQWKKISNQFDSDFQKHLNIIIREAQDRESGDTVKISI